MELRHYQSEIKEDVLTSSTDDIVQLDTGAGKTPIEVALFAHAEYAIIIAHRNVLITQCSAVVARFGIKHDTISSEFTRRRCMQVHRQTGRNYIERGNSKKIVASIDSLISHYRRSKISLDTNKPWLIIIDEAHHVIPQNKWGQLKEIFANARLIGFTATPGRMDGASLSVFKGGMFHRLIQCAWLRENSTKKLIDTGQLCSFKAYSPVAEIRNKPRTCKINIATSPVKAYKKYLNGERTIVMCPAIKNAKEIADQFIAAGISAASISSDMSGHNIWRILEEFRSGNINVLCNVDMVGEGFDVPAVSGLLICRYTKSFIMYRQWIGRVLRTAPGKIIATIVDLVGVITQHGEPDESVIWDLENPQRTPKVLVNHPCCECGLWFPVVSQTCPECGAKNSLLIGQSVTSHYVNVNELDMGLVMSARRQISYEQAERSKGRELYFSDITIGRGLLGESIKKIRKSLAFKLREAGKSVREINYCINENEITKTETFWIKHFTISDAQNMTLKKALKAYNYVKNKSHTC